MVGASRPESGRLDSGRLAPVVGARRSSSDLSDQRLDPGRVAPVVGARRPEFGGVGQRSRSPTSRSTRSYEATFASPLLIRYPMTTNVTKRHPSTRFSESLSA